MILFFFMKRFDLISIKISLSKSASALINFQILLISQISIVVNDSNRLAWMSQKLIFRILLLLIGFD